MSLFILLSIAAKIASEHLEDCKAYSHIKGYFFPLNPSSALTGDGVICVS